MSEVPQGFTPTVIIYHWAKCAYVTGIRRAKRGNYGPISYPNGLACVETRRLEAAIGRPIPHDEILTEHKIHRGGAALARKHQRAKAAQVAQPKPITITHIHKTSRDIARERMERMFDETRRAKPCP